jgi:sugar lactone lactonase YvrE
MPLRAATGYRVVMLSIDERKVEDFIKNVKETPASRQGRYAVEGHALERPIDVKFGPDGSMYVLDFGQMKTKDGRPEVRAGTGKIYRLTGTQPTETAQTKP